MKIGVGKINAAIKTFKNDGTIQKIIEYYEAEFRNDSSGSSAQSQTSTTAAPTPEVSTTPIEQETTEAESAWVNHQLYGVSYNVPDFGYYIGGTIIRSYTSGDQAYFQYDPSSLGISADTALTNYGAVLVQYGFTFSHASPDGRHVYKNSEYAVLIGITNSVVENPFEVCIIPE